MIVEARRDVVTLRGSLEGNDWPTIQAAAKVLLEEHPKGIIIDCSQLTEVTEAGARTFLDAITYIQKQDAKIIVAGLPENVLEVIMHVRAVMSQLPIAPTVEDARSSLWLEGVESTRNGRGLRVVVTLMISDWQRAVEVACGVADRKRDEIHFVDILKVPRNIPLATPLPEAEAAVRRKLDDAERAAKPYKVRMVRHVERVRTITEGLHHVLTELKPEMLVICVGGRDEEAHEIVTSVMPHLMADPPCEIIYDRRPGE